MPELARLALLVILLAVFWNLARGTLRPWLRAKFLGEGVSGSSRLSRAGVGKSMPRAGVGSREPEHRDSPLDRRGRMTV